jgi:hypothetical protein
VGGRPTIVSVLPTRPNFAVVNRIVCFIKIGIFLGAYDFDAKNFCSGLELLSAAGLKNSYSGI